MQPQCKHESIGTDIVEYWGFNTSMGSSECQFKGTDELWAQIEAFLQDGVCGEKCPGFAPILYCKTCGGDGFVSSGKDEDYGKKCAACNGKGVIPEGKENGGSK